MEKIGLEGIFKTEAFQKGLSIYSNGLKQANNETKTAANVLGSVLTVGAGAAVIALAALSAAAIGTAVALAKLVSSASTYGDKFSQMSLVTGIATERLQELAYAGLLLDVELETITSGLRFLTRNMYAAREGTGEQAEAFRELGIEILDINGELRNSDTVFGEVIDALGKMKNPTQADAIAMKLMGRSAMELNPLIKAGSKALSEYSLEAHKMGAVIDDEVIQALDKYRDQMDALKLTINVLKVQIGGALVPAFQSFLDIIRQIISSERFQAWFDNLVTSITNFSTHFAEFLRRLFGIKDINLPTIPEEEQQPQAFPEGTQYIYSGNKAFDKAMEDFWNGLGSDPRLWTAIESGFSRAQARKIAMLDEGIPQEEFVLTPFEQAIQDFVNGLKDVDWTAFGTSIKDFIKALMMVDWVKMASDFLTASANIAEFISKLPPTTGLDKFKADFNQGYGDFIRGLNTFMGYLINFPDTLAIAVGWVGIKIDEAKLALSTFFDKMSKGISTALETFRTNINTELAKLPGIFTEFGKAIGRGVIAMVNGLITLINKILTAFKLPTIAPIETENLYGGGYLAPGEEAIVGDAPGRITGFEELIKALPGGGVRVYPNRPASAGLGAGATTNNIVINNPVPEKASSSIDTTLKRLSYLGVA